MITVILNLTDGKETFGGLIDESSVNCLLHIIDLTNVNSIDIVRSK